MSHRIVCTVQKPAGTDHDAAHIVNVGVGDDPSGADQKFTVQQVRDKIDDNIKFYTKSESTGKTAEVEKYTCGCGYETIRTKPDERIDNNLDDLRECNWQ